MTDIDQMMSVQDETLLRLLDELCWYVSFHKLSPEWLLPRTMADLYETIAKLRLKADHERWLEEPRPYAHQEPSKGRS